MYLSSPLPNSSSATSYEETTTDPEKLKIVEKLIKEGHLSLEDGLKLLEQHITNIYNNTYPNTYPNPYIPYVAPQPNSPFHPPIYTYTSGVASGEDTNTLTTN